MRSFQGPVSFKRQGLFCWLVLFHSESGASIPGLQRNLLRIFSERVKGLPRNYGICNEMPSL